MIRRLARPAAYVLATAASFVWVPLYYDLPTWIGWAFIAGAAVLGLISSPDAPPTPTGRLRRLAAFAILAASAGLLEPPLRFVAALASIGALFGGTRGIVGRIGSSARLVGAIGLAEGIGAGIYVRFLANAHMIPPLAAFDRALGRIAGLDVAVVSGQSFFPGPTGVVAVTPTWDHLGAVFGWIALLGAVALVCLSATKRSGTRCAASAALTGVYLIARRFVLLLVAIELDRPELFWDPAVTIGSLLPLALFLVWLVGRARRAPNPNAASTPPRRTVLVLAGAFLGTLLLVAGATLSPPGASRSGAVLFDEAHGDWESTLRPLDTEWYGMSSTYNYASLYEWLAYYAPVGRITGEIDAAALVEAQVLVLKTPSIPYTEREIDAIAAYVRSGGGLLVIGDHTNVFGSTTVVNPILRRFGLALRYDSTYDLATGSFTVVDRAAHPADPIGQHVKCFEFLTSCSLEPSLAAIPVLRDVRVLANQADYGTRDFFPKERFTHASIFGAVTQAAAAAYGRGRVVVFTDSTCFSNFSMHMDGYADFVLATLGYLDRANPRLPVRSILLGFGIALLAFAVWGAVRSRTARAVGLGLLLAWAAGPWAVSALHRAWYPLPEPVEEIPYVYFDVSSSAAIISAQPTVSDDSSSQLYETFFVWTQRIGLVPRIVAGAESLVPGRAIVWIDPNRALDDADLDRAASYVASGGGLLVLGRPARDAAALATIAARFDRGLTAARGGGWAIAGAEILTREISPSLNLTVSVAPFGDGRLILVSDSSPFSDLSLGSSFVVPSSIQAKLNDVEFELFELLLGDVPGAPGLR